MTQDIFGCEKYSMRPNIRIHSVRFSKIRAYLMYPLVLRDFHVSRSDVAHLVFQSQTLEELGIFEIVRVINDHSIFEEQLM